MAYVTVSKIDREFILLETKSKQSVWKGTLAECFNYLESEGYKLITGEGSNSEVIFVLRKDLRVKIPDSSLSQDMKTAVNNKKFSNLTFIVEDKPIHVHKIILFVRAPYLLEMAEKVQDKQNCVVLEEQYNVFLKFIELLYCGETTLFANDNEKSKKPDVEAMLDKLTKIAKKYQLEYIANELSRLQYQTFTVVLSPNKLRADFRNAVNNAKFSDCMLVVEKVPIHAHKIFLITRCEFF